MNYLKLFINNNKRGIFLLLFILSVFYSNAQTLTNTQFKTDVESFRIDKLGNYYLINGNSVTKTDHKLEKIAVYDAKLFGDISDIDVSNPFRVLVYYKDFNTIVFLDNYLSELRAPISLDDLNKYDIDQVCYSYIGSFRIFDNQNSRIELYNKDLNIIQNGVNLYSIIKEQRAIKLRESSNYISLLFESGQIILLDKFGNLYKELANKNIEDFEFDNDNLYLLTNNKIILYKTDVSETKEIYLHEETEKIKDFTVYDGNLYIMSNKIIRIYKIQDLN